MKTVREVRAGINTRNIAISSDGKYAIVGNYLPHNLVILDTETLLTTQVIETKDTNGKSSRVSGVYNAPSCHSFVVALKDVKEVWKFLIAIEAALKYLKIGRTTKVYDANTLEEIKRLPMKKPSGKYYFYNKINYEKGTNH